LTALKAPISGSYLEDEAGAGRYTGHYLARRVSAAKGQSLRQRNAPLGVIIRAGEKQGEDIHRVAPFLDMLQVVALEFPIYRNGRGFSSARILRQELGFAGEIRATGDVLHDQWQAMARCGINAFEIDAKISLDEFTQALGELSDAYQPAADQQRGILWRRHGL
jgi:uncharacterized protein (DUF934 family)